MSKSEKNNRKWYRLGKKGAGEEVAEPVILGEYAFEKTYLIELCRRISELTAGDAGAELGDMAGALDTSRAAMSEVLKDMAGKGEGALVRRVFYSGPGWEEKLLSSFEQGILEGLRTAGSAGLDPLVMKTSGAREALERTVELGLSVHLSENLYMDRAVLKELIERFLEDKTAGTVITIAGFRDSTGLSRRYIIPIFNIMEEQGFVERREDDRVVL